MWILLAAAALFLLPAQAAAGVTSISPVDPQEEREQANAQWRQAIESILSNIVLGPLKPEFTPAFVERRTRDSIIAAQRNYFRAYVARIIMQSLAPEGLITVQPPPEVAPEVVEAQVQELREHSFSVRWVANGAGGPFVINVPRTKEK